MRGAAKCLHIFSDVFAFNRPSHTAIQNWILQYGLHQLTAPIQRRPDWIYILDHTIEFGPQKCLLILGVTQQQLMKKPGALTHTQVRVLASEISRKTNGEHIHSILQQVVEKTGVPVQMVSDAGSDIKKGIGLICQCHPAIRATYDITHKCGLILKHALERDMRWRRFQAKYTLTKRKCVHSGFAFIAPKKLKDKSRWMNLDTCVDWAYKVLAFRANISETTFGIRRKKKSFETAYQKIFGWLNEFTEPLQEWDGILQILSIARNEVKTHGLRADTLPRFNEKISTTNNRTQMQKTVIEQLQIFLKEQTEGIEPEQKYLGSSDIIESVFAKYKNFSARTPMKGIGKAVLTIPVFLSNVTTEKVSHALSQTSNKNLNKWLSDNIGESIFAQRKKAFSFSTAKSCEISA